MRGKVTKVIFAFSLAFSFSALSDSYDPRHVIPLPDFRSLENATPPAETFERLLQEFGDTSDVLGWNEVEEEPIVARRLECAMMDYQYDRGGNPVPLGNASVHPAVGGIAWDKDDDDGEEYLVSVLTSGLKTSGYNKVRPSRKQKGAERILKNEIEEGEGIEMVKRSGSRMIFDCGRGRISTGTINTCEREVYLLPNRRVEIHQIDYWFNPNQNIPTQSREEVCK